MVGRTSCCFSFFFNDTATTEIYTLSLHDALPIWCAGHLESAERWDHVRSDCDRVDFDYVAAAGEGEIRRAGGRVSRRQGADPLAGTELVDRSAPHVRPGDRLPARSPRLHGGPDPDWAGALHCHGDRLE